MDEKDQYNKLFALLMQTLPKTLNSSNDKTTANNMQNRNRDKSEALKYYSFIQFNYKSLVNWLVFDIDEINGKNAIEVFTLYDMVYEVYTRTGCIPTYTMQTRRGYHFAFHLEKPVPLKNKKANKYLKVIKAAITNAMGCDPIASNRLSGIWRNPLRHPFWYSGEIDYTLSSFYHLVKKRPKEFTKFTNKNNPLFVKIADLVKGQRNNKLFLFAINYCLSHRSIIYDDLTNYLLELNKQAQPPLENYEVLRICKSAYNYKIKGTLHFPKNKNKAIQVGIMKFPTMEEWSDEKYISETKKRQSRAAIRTNILVSKATKEKAMKKARECKIDLVHGKILTSIKQAVVFLQTQNKKLNYSNIAKVTQLDRRTVKKYVIKYNLFHGN